MAVADRERMVQAGRRLATDREEPTNSGMASTQCWALVWVHPEYSKPSWIRQGTLVLGADEQVMLGRFPGAHAVTLDRSPWVSRVHARIIPGESQGAPVLENLSQTNSTFLDGVAVERPTPLFHGAVVRVGDWVALVVHGSHHELVGPYPFASHSADREHPLLGGAAMAALADQVRAELSRFEGQRASERSSRGFLYPVLVYGETGTGKEGLARMIHGTLRGARAPWVSQNAGSIPEHLFELEWFGCERDYPNRGDRERTGLLNAARGGTLLLDDIQNLSAAHQPKLLRLIEEGTFRRLGSTEENQLDVLLVATINRDLNTLVADGAFLPDLAARFRRRFALPPLRERKADLPGLLRHYLGAEAELRGRPTPPELRGDLVAALFDQPFDDNIRGVQALAGALIDRALTESQNSLRLQHLPSRPSRPQNEPVKDSPSLESILEALRISSGVVVRAARLLNISKQRFYDTEPYATALAQYRGEER